MSRIRRTRLAADPILAGKILDTVPDEFLLTPEVVAAAQGFGTVIPLEKQRHAGDGPEFVRVGKLVRYPAGKVRKYLSMLAPRQISGR